MGLGWIIVAVAVIAANRLQGTALFLPAVIVALLNLVSFGYSSRFGRGRERPLLGYPTSVSVATTVSILTTVLAIVLLAYSFVVARA